MLIQHARAFLNGVFKENTDIRTSDGIITEVGFGLKKLPDEQAEDYSGDSVLPGFVDVHTHAYGGNDTMNGEAALRSMSRAYRRLGVAAFLPTTMSGTIQETASALEGIRQIMLHPEENGAAVAGAHMEAPFLNPLKCGAQRKECFLSPDWDTLLQLCNGHPETVRLITIAPELPGADTFIAAALKAGITVSAGHTNATAEEVHHAADLGLNHITHTFNAQPALHHRKPGVPGAALADPRLYTEAICDGFHLHPDIIRLMIRCKGAERFVAITDSMEAAGMPDGTYSLGGQAVYVHDGKATLEDGTIAGSTLDMPAAFRNLIGWGIAPEDAIRVCSETPADSVGLKKYGRIAPGCSAVMTRWNKNWEMIEVC